MSRKKYKDNHARFFCATFKSGMTVKCLILFTFFHQELV